MALDVSDKVAYAAMFISLIALLIALLQALQQYFSSADGYRRCASSVMGEWSNGTRRRFRLFEFRIEVLYQTPVLFLSSPMNQNGPLGGKDSQRPIFYLNGSDRSYRETRTPHPKSVEVRVSNEARMNVLTSDDERASWLALLMELQREERESRAWDKHPSSTQAAANEASPHEIDRATHQNQGLLGTSRKVMEYFGIRDSHHRMVLDEETEMESLLPNKDNELYTLAVGIQYKVIPSQCLK